MQDLFKRLDTENALFQILGGKQRDYVLNNILLSAEYKSLVAIGIETLEYIILLKVVVKIRISKHVLWLVAWPQLPMVIQIKINLVVKIMQSQKFK